MHVTSLSAGVTLAPPTGAKRLNSSIGFQRECCDKMHEKDEFAIDCTNRFDLRYVYRLLKATEANFNILVKNKTKTWPKCTVSCFG